MPLIYSVATLQAYLADRRRTLQIGAKVRQSFLELEATLPSVREIREVKLQHAGNLAGVEGTHSISITRA
jgi:hypothetical protein